jgi:hypothetical protein
MAGSAVDQDVLRFHVAVHDSGLVRRVQRRCHGHQQCHRLGGVQGAGAPVPEQKSPQVTA